MQQAEELERASTFVDVFHDEPMTINDVSYLIVRYLSGTGLLTYVISIPVISTTGTSTAWELAGNLVSSVLGVVLWGLVFVNGRRVADYMVKDARRPAQP